MLSRSYQIYTLIELSPHRTFTYQGLPVNQFRWSQLRRRTTYEGTRRQSRKVNAKKIETIKRKLCRTLPIHQVRRQKDSLTTKHFVFCLIVAKKPKGKPPTISSILSKLIRVLRTFWRRQRQEKKKYEEGGGRVVREERNQVVERFAVRLGQSRGDTFSPSFRRSNRTPKA